MPIRPRQFAFALGALCLTMAAACKKPVTPLVTLVGSAVGTLEHTTGVGPVGSSACAPNPTPPAPDVTGWYNAMPPANKRYPVAGFQLWRNGDPGCTVSRLDVYHALVTFNMASVSSLKGLVTKAELAVSTRALPDSAGRLVTLGTVNATCPAMLGGGGALQRFGPSAAGSLPPVSGVGMLTAFPQFGPSPFPVGNVVYTFPASFAAGPVAGAATPTTLGPTGTGGAVFVTDVTSQVNAALNGGFAGMSWTLTSAFEGPLTVPVPVMHNIDCRTFYDFQLRLTHY